MSLYSQASIIIPPEPPIKTGFLSAIDILNSSIVDFTVTRALDTATRVNQDGIIELVAANTARIDFAEGTGVGSLLLEPTRENTMTHSSNISLNITSNTTTITSNTAIAPDGTLSADKIEDTSAAATQEGYYNPNTLLAGQWQTFSLFIKKDNNESRFPEFFNRMFNGGTSEVYSVIQLNTKTGAIIERVGGGTRSYKIEDYGDYWRLQISLLDNNTGNVTYRFYIRPAFTDVFGNVANNATTGFIEVWGLQNEVGSYATSYIPTSGSTVTRNRDAISLNGINALLGDNAGTFMVDVKWFETLSSISLSDGTSGNRLSLYSFNNLVYIDRVGTAASVNGGESPLNVFSKIVYSYDNSGIVVHQDGDNIITSLTSTSYPTGTLNKLSFDIGTGSSGFFYGRLKSLLVYKTALDTEASEVLTSYHSFKEIADNKKYTIL